jgi:hypothetical protein
VVSVINSTDSPPHHLSAQGNGKGHSTTAQQARHLVPISGCRKQPVNDGDGLEWFCKQETAARQWCVTVVQILSVVLALASGVSWEVGHVHGGADLSGGAVASLH